jgi:hypothetical protein
MGELRRERARRDGHGAFVVGVDSLSKGLVMNRVRTSFFGLGLAFTLLCSVTGCRIDESEEPSDELAQSAGVTPAACVSFAGNPHCSLGTARLRLSLGGLTVSGMSSAGKDGVSISLPDVTSFLPTGTYANSAATSTMIATSVNEGVSTSTVKAVNTDLGTSYSATFTGSGQASTYSAILSRNGQEVARVGGIRNGEVGIPPVLARGRIWRWIKFHVRIVPAFAALSGACSWEQSFDPSSPATVTLASGQTIEVDNLELLEEVSPGGGYPYLSFNRIDYTADGGTFTVTKEELR